jgi:hypothetical protein
MTNVATDTHVDGFQNALRNVHAPRRLKTIVAYWVIFRFQHSKELIFLWSSTA